MKKYSGVSTMEFAFFMLIILLILGLVLTKIRNYLHQDEINYEKSHIKNYAVINIIDDNRYIRCIEDQTFIITRGGILGNDKTTQVLDESGKPKKCTTKLYTYNEMIELEKTNVNTAFIKLNN